MIKRSHILIGCPGCGKSTLAAEIVNHDNNYRIVSTDKIREQLFGNEIIQGDWQLIEAEAFRQIEQHLSAGNPIIYDATNGKRHWRMSLLQQLAKLGDNDWIGWYLDTPLKICQAWNQQRERKVPSEVIEKIYNSIKRFPPIAAEGFTAVYDISYPKEKLDITTFKGKIAKLSRTPVNRNNRTNNRKVCFHGYSRLLDFDRLMHLISLIIRYPGIGNLQKTNPSLITKIFGDGVFFNTPLDEIAAFQAFHSDKIYADKQALATDLQWLEKNGIIGDSQDIQEIDIPKKEYTDLVTHTYSEIEPFQRLIKTIRFIAHHPFSGNEQQGSLKSLMTAMQEGGIIDLNCSGSIRKDIEKILKPFGILPNFAMKRGYFIGTGILSKQQLISVFRLLEAQAKSLEDPATLLVYETFKERLGYSQLALPEVYPVRAIYNKTIVDSESLHESSLAHKIDEVEEAIASASLLELNRLKGGGKFSASPNEFFLAYPLQLVFNNIGWYLGFEYVGGDKDGLLSFERIDRLFLGRQLDQKRDRQQQEKSLKKLQRLYLASGGIFLGNNPQLQRLYLSSNKTERAKVEVKIELWFNDHIFRFISEGTKRFPLTQMKMSPRLDESESSKKKPPFSLAKTSDKLFPNRFLVTLPQWSLNDIDLLRWIVGFGGQVKVVNPPELVLKVKELGEAIAKLYD